MKLRTPNPELRTVWLTARVDATLHEDLGKASRANNISQSEIARKALRKAARLKPDLAAAEKKLGSTYQGGMLRVEVESHQQCWADQLRAVLRWYLDLPREEAPQFASNLREGVDYTVKQWD